MPVITYNSGADPVETGVYAVRVPSDAMPGLHEDMFLMWFEGQWSYLSSDTNYRGTVIGWIGPLQRTRQGSGPAPMAALKG